MPRSLSSRDRDLVTPPLRYVAPLLAFSGLRLHSYFLQICSGRVPLPFIPHCLLKALPILWLPWSLPSP